MGAAGALLAGASLAAAAAAAAAHAPLLTTPEGRAPCAVGTMGAVVTRPVWSLKADRRDCCAGLPAAAAR